VENVLVCDSRVLLKAFKQRLEETGISTSIVNFGVQGNAQEVGDQFASSLLSWIHGQKSFDVPLCGTNMPLPIGRKFAWLYGGETTVQFPKGIDIAKAKGGRNQEMVLSVFNALRKSVDQKVPNRSFCFMSIGSDGQVN
jgi:glycerate-2-kinase